MFSELNFSYRTSNEWATQVLTFQLLNAIIYNEWTMRIVHQAVSVMIQLSYFVCEQLESFLIFLTVIPSKSQNMKMMMILNLTRFNYVVLQNVMLLLTR